MNNPIKGFDFVDGKLVRVNPKGKSKYNNKRVTVNGVTFDSNQEYGRFKQLDLLRLAREIFDLKVHPKYDLIVNGEKVCRYTPDFEYLNDAGERVVEDVKPYKPQGVKLELKPFVEPYDRVRHKLFTALEGVEVTYINKGAI